MRLKINMKLAADYPLMKKKLTLGCRNTSNSQKHETKIQQ